MPVPLNIMFPLCRIKTAVQPVIDSGLIFITIMRVSVIHVIKKEGCASSQQLLVSLVVVTLQEISQHYPDLHDTTTYMCAVVVQYKWTT